MYKTITINKPLLPGLLFGHFSDIFNTSLDYNQAPSIIINRMNKTNTIAAPEPFPQLLIIHSSFFSIHHIVWKKKKNVRTYI